MIKTKVGLTTHETNFYCGLDLSEQVGKWQVIDLITQSMLGRKLSPPEKSVLDALSVAQCVADPHAWPLKIARCAAREGRVFKGLSGVLSYFESAPIGPHQMKVSAELLQTWHAANDKEHFLAGLRDKEIIPGFGVFGRPTDERVVAFKGWLATRARPPGPYFSAYQDLVEGLRERNENNTLISAALLLDMGFSPQNAEAIGLYLLLPPIFANVLESAAAQNSELKNIPGPQFYFGPQARLSPKKASSGKSEHNDG